MQLFADVTLCALVSIHLCTYIALHGYFSISVRPVDQQQRQLAVRCGIRGISNDWCKSYLSNCNQHVSINGFDSGLTTINCGVPQGSVLGPLLFLLYINDLNQAIKFCKVHHFADDTNLLYLSNSIKNLNKLVSADWKPSS